MTFLVELPVLLFMLLIDLACSATQPSPDVSLRLGVLVYRFFIWSFVSFILLSLLVAYG